MRPRHHARLRGAVAGRLCGARDSPRRHGISCRLSKMMPAHHPLQLLPEIPDAGDGTGVPVSRRQLNVIRCDGEEQHQNVLAKVANT